MSPAGDGCGEFVGSTFQAPAGNPGPPVAQPSSCAPWGPVLLHQARTRNPVTADESKAAPDWSTVTCTAAEAGVPSSKAQKSPSGKPGTVSPLKTSNCPAWLSYAIMWSMRGGGAGPTGETSDHVCPSQAQI